MQYVINLIQTKKSGVDELDIKLAEEKLGAIFPEQYKELFKLVNNAEIGEWILYPIKDHRNPKKTWDDVVRQNIEVIEEGMSKDLIAIGDDGSGDKICLKINNGKMEDVIYLWYHETTEIDEYAPNLEGFIILISEENGDFDDE
ncbi:MULTISPECIES: SMI1/KNR4 family protein [unclassified Bacillus (in: firmicutes)]|uniref:SMI1/KNR4 family protein n=1 Tax=unclassified Bacillus (in: firmicutes) TaxID=185979 RepID=UPI0008E147DE|nr:MULTISPECIES: SMI1/KNR4 family protein [unclassified Bacillus (in: firmicutes)]SFA99804.1 SMI1-KNR4 cell-wall [Bacillus sp. UNCCL13]SFQ81806.1 SMI1-KNR4 cell-wall [Bacillus sp. cl95]